MHYLALFGEAVGVIVGILAIVALALGLFAAFILRGNENPFM